MIKANGIYKSYGQLEVLRGVDIEIEKGEKQNQLVYNIFTTLYTYKDLQSLVKSSEKNKILNITKDRIGGSSNFQLMEWISEADNSHGVLIKLLVSCNLYEDD